MTLKLAYMYLKMQTNYIYSSKQCNVQNKIYLRIFDKLQFIDFMPVKFCPACYPPPFYMIDVEGGYSLKTWL